jgi:hypothetical protein
VVWQLDDEKPVSAIQRSSRSKWSWVCSIRAAHAGSRRASSACAAAGQQVHKLAVGVVHQRQVQRQGVAPFSTVIGSGSSIRCRQLRRAGSGLDLGQVAQLCFEKMSFIPFLRRPVRPADLVATLQRQGYAVLSPEGVQQTGWLHRG